MPTFLLVLTFTNAQRIPIGTIKEARIATNAPSVWLYNQSSSAQCVCYSLQYPPTVAFNSFPMNFSCQLFRNLSGFSFQVISNPNGSVGLLQPLQPYTPCCSNLTWLLMQMQTNTQSLNITSLQGLALDTDHNTLAAVGSAALQLISADPLDFTFVTASRPTNARPISYNQNFFYVGVFPAAIPYVFHIYNASNLTKVGTMNFSQGSPQRIVWLFNGTLACTLTQNGSASSSANFHNWPSQSLNRSVSLPIGNAFGLGKAPNEDSFVYITDGSLGGRVWRLKTLPPYNFSSFASSMTSSESPANLAIDSCNRMWVAFFGFGVRIYDVNSTVMLNAWNMTASLPASLHPLDLVLNSHYQLYLADYSPGRLTRYGSALQCTDWSISSFFENSFAFIYRRFSHLKKCLWYHSFTTNTQCH